MHIIRHFIGQLKIIFNLNFLPTRCVTRHCYLMCFIDFAQTIECLRILSFLKLAENILVFETHYRPVFKAQILK